MNGWVNVLGMSVLRRTHWPVWVERPFSCDGLGWGTTSPGCCQSGWRRHPATTSPGCCQSGWRSHSAVMVRAEESHHLGITRLGGETIQLWWGERRNHITWVLPVWVETAFSCDGQCGGTTSPGHYPSGWRNHSAVMVRAEEPHHLGAASLGGNAIQRWSSERRNHITWVLPVWVETPFSCDGQGGGTTSSGCCQSGWRDHSAVMARTEKPPSPGRCQSYWKIEEVEPIIGWNSRKWNQSSWKPWESKEMEPVIGDMETQIHCFSTDATGHMCCACLSWKPSLELKLIYWNSCGGLCEILTGSCGTLHSQWYWSLKESGKSWDWLGIVGEAHTCHWGHEGSSVTSKE